MDVQGGSPGFRELVGLANKSGGGYSVPHVVISSVARNPLSKSSMGQAGVNSSSEV